MPKKTPSKEDRVVNMTAEINVDTGEIVFRYQSEVETLAFEILGTAENIFFQKQDPEESDDLPLPAEIPIGNNITIEYDNKYFRGWVLHTLNSDCI